MNWFIVDLNVKRKCDFCSKIAVIFYYKDIFYGQCLGYLCENHRIDFENGRLKV